MPTNFYMFFVSALIPMVIGFIYYSEALFGKKWMKVNGFTKEQLESGNMVVILGVSYLMSVLLSFGLSGIVIHQGNVFQVMMPEVMEAGSAAETTFNEFMATYGDRHRGFGHGVLHGVLFTILIALPIISINALFEQRGWAYIGIHFGYWLLTTTAIGALLCGTLVY